MIVIMHTHPPTPSPTGSRRLRRVPSVQAQEGVGASGGYPRRARGEASPRLSPPARRERPVPHSRRPAAGGGHGQGDPGGARGWAGGGARRAHHAGHRGPPGAGGSREGDRWTGVFDDAASGRRVCDAWLFVRRVLCRVCLRLTCL